MSEMSTISKDGKEIIKPGWPWITITTWEVSI
jgi:hypothetical protein